MVQKCLENTPEKSEVGGRLQTEQRGSPTEVQLLPKMSEAIFRHDGVPAFYAARTQGQRQDNLFGLWKKGKSPRNSPELSPIEYLWTIAQPELNKRSPLT